jgi:protocatechuate 3,4-dioxygenase beta subunit
MLRHAFTLLAASLLAPAAFAQPAPAAGPPPAPAPGVFIGAVDMNVVVDGGGGIQVTMPAVPSGTLAPRDVRPRTGTSTIAGRVVDADSGQPVRRAVVRINSPQLGPGRTVSTDADGRYRFATLPAGSYTVSASKSGYVNTTFGQPRPNGPGKPVQLVDGQETGGIDIRLPKGGVIAGRVVDEYGDPVPDAMVSPMRSQYARGRRQLMPAGRPATTNDAGEFRIFGLSPGQYAISVMSRPGFNENSDDRTGYAPTYLPGTSDQAAAQFVTIAAGQTIDGLVVSLALTPTAKISGTAFDSEGRPLTQGGVSAMPSRATGFFGPNASSPLAADGSFTLSGLAPGDYVVRANARPTTPGVPPEMAVAFVSVNGADVTGLVLAPLKPATIRGRFTAPDVDALRSRGAVMVMAQHLEPDVMLGGMGFGKPSPIGEDLSFELTTSPGRILLPVRGLPPGWMVSAVRVNGVDATDTGLEVDSGEVVSGVEIELTDRAPVISGLVTDAKGSPIAGAWVLLFSQDPAHWSLPNNRYVVLMRAGAQGRYTVQTLPPGDYHALALEAVENGAAQDPEFLDRMRTSATRTTIREGDALTLDLRAQADAR